VVRAKRATTGRLARNTDSGRSRVPDKQNPDAVEQNRDAVKQNRDAVKQNRDAIKQNPDAVKQNRDAIKQNPDAIKQNPDAIKQNPDIDKLNLVDVRILPDEHVLIDSQMDYNPTFLNLKAFPITVTELNVIAALAIIGLNSNPKKG
jgi:hypothetical protein